MYSASRKKQADWIRKLHIDTTEARDPCRIDMSGDKSLDFFERRMKANREVIKKFY